jgi:hypothetical protein
MKLYISEHASTGNQIVTQPPLAEQVIVIGPNAEQSIAFGEHTRIVRLHASVACSIAISKAPEVTIDNARLAANQTEIFAVQPGDRLAVIANP